LYAAVVKEIWDLAISGQVLPFTFLLLPIGLYWILAALGTLDLHFLHLDVDGHADAQVDAHADAHADGHADGGHESGHGHFLATFHGALKLVNATDVPLMIVLSILGIMMWGCAMLGNLWFNPQDTNLRGTIVGVGAIAGGLVLTRLLTEPLKPVFRAMKGDGTPNRPVIGRSGTVRTNELTDRSGQVQIEENGEVLLHTARRAEGADPLHRGTEVFVYGYDTEKGIYYVKNLSTS
jgi:hypothetical protein